MIIRSGAFPSFCYSFFRSASEKRITDKTGSTMLPQAKESFESATA
jgi:hypothetical protein